MSESTSNSSGEHWIENKFSTILIVDDDEVNREFFEVMLKRLNFNVICAVDGEEALEKVTESRINLILLDNLLPKYSGWEVTRIIRNDPEYEPYKNIPIIMFSAMNTSEGKIKGFDLGIDDYITKPFNFVEVLARIKAVLRYRLTVEQIIQREKQLAIADTLGKSLVYFSNHVKIPIKRLQKLSYSTAHHKNAQKSLEELSTAVQKDTENIMLALAELEEELAVFERKRVDLKAKEISIDTLDQKYRKSLRELDS